MANYSESFEYRSDYECSEVSSFLSSVCKGFGWECVNKLHDRLLFRTGASLKSFGEEISIIINDDENIILITSTNQQLVDWGKNKSNVKKLIENISTIEAGNEDEEEYEDVEDDDCVGDEEEDDDYEFTIEDEDLSYKKNITHCSQCGASIVNVRNSECEYCGVRFLK